MVAARRGTEKGISINCRSFTFECMEGSCSDLFLIMPFTHIVALPKCSGVDIKPFDIV